MITYKCKVITHIRCFNTYNMIFENFKVQNDIKSYILSYILSQYLSYYQSVINDHS